MGDPRHIAPCPQISSPILSAQELERQHLREAQDLAQRIVDAMQLPPDDLRRFAATYPQTALSILSLKVSRE